MSEAADKKYYSRMCVCGHLEIEHGGWEAGQENEYPTGCNFDTIQHSCNTFKLDNLRMLELLEANRYA